LEYITSSFDETDVKDLLEDAFLFNPMISQKKDTSEEIPADVREKLKEQRRKWMEEHADR
jgi:hypothetical protein